MNFTSLQFVAHDHGETTELRATHDGHPMQVFLANPLVPSELADGLEMLASYVRAEAIGGARFYLSKDLTDDEKRAHGARLGTYTTVGAVTRNARGEVVARGLRWAKP